MRRARQRVRSSTLNRGEVGGGVSVGVEMGGVGDLFGRQAAASHRDAVAVEEPADGVVADAELGSEFVDGRSDPVAGDQLLDPMFVESASTAWSHPP